MSASIGTHRWAVAAGLAVLCATTAAATEDLRIGLATTPRLPARSERTTFEITVADAAGAPQAAPGSAWSCSCPRTR